MSILDNLCIIDNEKTEKFIEKVARNVKKARLDKEMTQLELSLLIGQKSASFYANAENNARGRRFNLEHLFKIAEVLEVDICQFFKD